MEFLIPLENGLDEGTELQSWPGQFRNFYTDNTLCSGLLTETFLSAFSLFPIMRALERDSRRYSKQKQAVDEIFAAIVTDRGLLAEQTRDAFRKGNQSRITTRLTYTPILQPKERHEECKRIALQAALPLWKGYFKGCSNYEKFGTLLDAFYKQCISRRKASYRSVQFPEPNIPIPKPGSEEEENDPGYPEDWEIQFAEQTRVLLAQSDEETQAAPSQPALAYFRNLAAREKAGEFTDREFVLFIQRILPAYCRRDKILQSIKPGKQYDACISKSDSERLEQQAASCAELIICKRFVQPIRPIRNKRGLSGSFDTDKVEKLTQLFLQHHSHCASCRSSDKSRIGIENFCRNFSERIFRHWTALQGDPFLIFRLWTTAAQSPYAQDRSNSLSVFLEQKANSIQTWDTPNVEKADRELLDGLFEVCFPQESGAFLQKGYQKLLENDGRSGIPITELYERKVKGYLPDCLPFQPIHLDLNYPTGIIQSEALAQWLEQNPPLLCDLEHSLNALTAPNPKNCGACSVFLWKSRTRKWQKPGRVT